MADRILLIVTGPVGGGKSTVSMATADCFRELGRATAVVDLDLVYCMARQVAGFGEDNTWTTARRGAAALADAFFAEGMDVVVIDGEFFAQRDLDALRNSLTNLLSTDS